MRGIFRLAHHPGESPEANLLFFSDLGTSSLRGVMATCKGKGLTNPILLRCWVQKMGRLRWGESVYSRGQRQFAVFGWFIGCVLKQLTWKWKGIMFIWGWARMGQNLLELSYLDKLIIHWPAISCYFRVPFRYQGWHALTHSHIANS